MYDSLCIIRVLNVTLTTGDQLSTNDDNIVSIILDQDKSVCVVDYSGSEEYLSYEWDSYTPIYGC